LAAEARWFLAQPEPQGPTDEEIDEETATLIPWLLVKAMQAADSDQSYAAGRLTLAAQLLGERRPTAQPEPQGPTDGEIEEAAKLIHASMRFAVPDSHYTRDWVERGNSLMQDEARRTARAVLARWGRPAIEPVPVSERLPGPEDCDAEGCCWWWEPDCEQPESWCLGLPEYCDSSTHWLPHWALPVPGVEGADA
jgi:hypothetical protein